MSSPTLPLNSAAPLEQKARELGRLLGQSAEYQALKRSNESLTSDREAVTILQRMEELRQSAQRMMDQGQEPSPEMEHELDTLLSKVQGSMSYQRAVTSQENFDKIMLQVNAWIAEGIRSGATSSIITLG